jgi:hypothetical protein
MSTPANVAQYLVELHDTKSVFDFCGGMMFQLVLTDKLREQLISVGAKQAEPAAAGYSTVV